MKKASEYDINLDCEVEGVYVSNGFTSIQVWWTYDGSKIQTVYDEEENIIEQSFL